MTDFTPNRSPVVPPLPPSDTPTAHDETHEGNNPLTMLSMNQTPKSAKPIMPWVVTLCLHGIIFSGAYMLYQRAVHGNQALANPATALSTTVTTQKDELKTLTDSTTPIAITQEAYAPSPKVRSDLPVLTTADIIAAGNAIRAAQQGDAAQSAAASTTASTTAMTALSTTSTTINNNSDTLANTNTAKITNLVLDASDEASTDHDLSAKDRKNKAKNAPVDMVTSEIDPKTKAKDKTATNKNTALKNSQTKTSKGNIQKTDPANQNSKDADPLTKSLEETTAEFNKNIAIVKNKNRQKITKEFNMKSDTSVAKASDSLPSEDEPANLHKKSK